MKEIVSAANDTRSTIDNKEEPIMKEIVNSANDTRQTAEKTDDKSMIADKLIKALSIAVPTTAILGIGLVESGMCFRCHDVEQTKRIGIEEPEITKRYRSFMFADIAKDSNATVRFREVHKTRRQENRLGFASAALPSATSFALNVASLALGI